MTDKVIVIFQDEDEDDESEEKISSEIQYCLTSTLFSKLRYEHFGLQDHQSLQEQNRKIDDFCLARSFDDRNHRFCRFQTSILRFQVG
jgi:hypothetical protein